MTSPEPKRARVMKPPTPAKAPIIVGTGPQASGLRWGASKQVNPPSSWIARTDDERNRAVVGLRRKGILDTSPTSASVKEAPGPTR